MPSVMGELDNPEKFIYLIRHGETDLNKEKRLRGWSNSPLNEQGLKDAEANGKALQVISLDAIYISDFRRTIQTSHAILNFQTGHAIQHIKSDLRTIDVGVWTGKLLSEVDPKLKAIQKDWQNTPDKEIPGGESWTKFQNRQLKIWKEIIADKSEHIAVVSHLRNSVWAMGYALTGGQPLVGYDLELLNRVTQADDKISIISYSKKEGLKILAMNTDNLLIDSISKS